MVDVITLPSDNARKDWRDTVDTAFAGTPVVLTRYDKPVAVLISHKEWLAIQAQHLIMLDAQEAEIEKGNFVTWEDAKAQMVADGLLDG